MAGGGHHREWNLVEKISYREKKLTGAEPLRVGNITYFVKRSTNIRSTQQLRDGVRWYVIHLLTGWTMEEKREADRTERKRIPTFQIHKKGNKEYSHLGSSIPSIHRRCCIRL
jgi:hypothetical protein